MSTDQHFAAINLWFRPAWTRDAKPIREGYCLVLLEPEAGAWVQQLRKVYSHAARTVTVGNKEWIRLQARTNADGWLMAQAGTGPEGLKALSTLEPLVLPMGQADRIWWTDNEAMFDEVLREADEDDVHLDPFYLPVARLLLDLNQRFPEAVQRRLDELKETLKVFQGDPDEAFPEALMQSVGDGQTRAIVLEDSRARAGAGPCPGRT